jgi:hypothetical protein
MRISFIVASVLAISSCDKPAQSPDKSALIRVEYDPAHPETIGATCFSRRVRNENRVPVTVKLERVYEETGPGCNTHKQVSYPIYNLRKGQDSGDSTYLGCSHVQGVNYQCTQDTSWTPVSVTQWDGKSEAAQ